MANVHEHTTAQFLEMVENGTITSQKGRIALWVNRRCPDGITRNTLAEQVFNVLDKSTCSHSALDGKVPIRWRAIGRPVHDLVEEGHIKQSSWKRLDPDSLTDKVAMFLFPADTPNWKLIQPPEKWDDYLRQYPQQQQQSLNL